MNEVSKATVTFTKACATFFGKRDGQALMEFQKELKDLTPADREYFKKEFAKIGVNVE